MSARLALAAALGLACAAAVGARATAGQTRAGPIMIGVLRSDGVLIPFGQFDGRRWSNPWPAPAAWRQPVVPLTFEDVPRDWWGRLGPQADWTLWKPAGSSSPLRATGTLRLPVHCLPTVGLRTDYVPANPAPPQAVQPYPKEGLAAAGDARLEPVERLSTDARERAGLLEVLAPQFEKAEAAAIRRFSDWTHPFPDSIRNATTIALEALYRVSTSKGREFYYVEAVKQYPSLEPRDDCGLVTFVRGWITLDDPADRDPKVTATVVYCHRAGASYLLPLGILHVAGRRFLISQLSGWDHEVYEVADLDKLGERPELTVPGGDCPRR
jgi:hypothetical protein